MAGLAAAILHGLVFLALSRAASDGARVEVPEVAVELFSASPAWSPPATSRPKPEAPSAASAPEATPVARSVSQPAAAAQATAAPTPVFQRIAQGAPAVSETAFTAGSASVSTATGIGTGEAASAGVGVRSAEDPYPAQVLAWIERHKRYPERGRAESLEGAVVVAVTLDRRGRVRAVDLIRSSGHGVLDDAALAQVRNASPFPAAPADSTWSRRRFEAPIVYRVRVGRA
ncbi:energy transducer TonB [Caulobacter mirabilis]|uniref:TonB C-terminal domain-containing protein n=1 Tax=Caulobacter mirabilis TaxID=69666 RepID=A0A2D2AYM6_9CAUL|nr:energy transducer TonB [Caulobacter mirabilis]ATQ43091.1 hypothetical protein CSW64_12045 [Caulobacter mirabilis]